jgi:hypothetical protein
LPWIDPVQFASYSVAVTMPFFPMMKHISQLQSNLAWTHTTETTTTESTRLKRVETEKKELKPLKIVVFTVWVSDQPLSAVERLNHQQYCEFHGYDFIYLWLSKHTYKERYGDLPYAWLSIEFAQELLRNYTDIDYLVKMDVDCLFARQDLRLETILYPKEYFSVYLSQIEESSRFTQSHMWIVKNDLFTQHFLERWLSYRTMDHCRDIAQEQGALHFTLGHLLAEYYSSNVSITTSNDHKNESTIRSIRSLTPFTCGMFCHSHRSAYHHHHCVLDWYEDNGFGMSGFFYHPQIYIYPFFSGLAATTTEQGQNNNNKEHFISPMDGYTLQIDSSKIMVKVNNKKKLRGASGSSSSSSESSNGGNSRINGYDGIIDYYQQKGFVSYPRDSGVNHKFKHKAVSLFQPLTIHSCKKNPYLSPVDVMKKLDTCH